MYDFERDVVEELFRLVSGALIFLGMLAILLGFIEPFTIWLEQGVYPDGVILYL